MNYRFKHILIYCCLLVPGINAFSQVTPVPDTFFLAKKKGLLGKLGKSLVKIQESEDPVKISVSFLKYSGHIIRSVEVFPLGFDQDIGDTSVVRENLAIKIANRVHVNTKIAIIRNYLFFKKGDKLRPLLLTDNEIYLRNQPFLKDAMIVVADAEDNRDSVDVIVLTKDVFSIGGNINANTRRAISELREENIAGTGSEISVSGTYDLNRNPRTGTGAELLLRNIRGTYLNLTSGFTSFNTAYNSNRNEEQKIYMYLEKPFVNRYTKWTGRLEISNQQTANRYISDSLYRSDFQYHFNNVDIWTGYNLGYLYSRKDDTYKHLRHFIAARAFYTNFEKVPELYNGIFKFDYANINGFLFSYSVYRQNYYRTNFIYAFGRNEDVPSGLSASIIAGWTNKENRRRPYYGFEFDGSRFMNGIYSYYRLKAGSSYKSGKLEDIDLLFSVDHFTRLRKLAPKWRNRNFISFSFTRKLNYEINTPLFLKSDYGLPYFQNGSMEADERATLKLESDFYNLDKFFGFRFAPFVFSDFCFLKPVNKQLSKTEGYTAFGGGFRARNENLVFGTIELKGFYFPRTVGSMHAWKIDLVSKVRFKFNTNFIRKPDFIISN